MRILPNSAPLSLSFYISHITSFLAHPQYSFQILLIATWCVSSASCRIGEDKKKKKTESEEGEVSQLISGLH